MELQAKRTLSTILNVLAWGVLLVGGILVSYGIYGRFTVRLKYYGPLSLIDFLIPAAWVCVVVAIFWGIKRLAKTIKAPEA